MAANISDLTECPICKDEYTTPRHLTPCLHIFCEDCIRQWAKHQFGSDRPGGSFQCPTCKTDTVIPRTGIQGFKNSFIVRQLQDEFKPKLQSRSIVHCDQHKENEAVMYCKKCQVRLCDDCTEEHQFHGICSLKTLEKGTKLPLNEKIQTLKTFSKDINERKRKLTKSHEDFKSNFSKELEKLDNTTETVQVVIEQLWKIHEKCQNSKEKLQNLVKPDLEECDKQMSRAESCSKNLRGLLTKAEELSTKNGTSPPGAAQCLLDEIKSTLEKSPEFQVTNFKKVTVEVPDVSNLATEIRALMPKLSSMKVSYERDIPVSTSRQETSENTRNVGQAATNSYEVQGETEEVSSMPYSSSGYDPYSEEEYENSMDDYTDEENDYDYDDREIESVPASLEAEPRRARFNIVTQIARFKSAKMVNDITIAENDDIVLAAKKKCLVMNTQGNILKDIPAAVFNVTSHENNIWGTNLQAKTLLSIKPATGQFETSLSLPFQNPSAIAMDTDLRKYISSLYSNIIYRKRTTDHAFIPFITGNGLNHPAYICTTKNNNLVVSNKHSHTVKLFSQDGTLLWTYGQEGESGSDEGHLFQPHGVTSDDLGNIYVADYSNSRVIQLSENGQFCRVVVSQDKEILYPNAIAINHQGQLVVSHLEYGGNAFECQSVSIFQI